MKKEILQIKNFIQLFQLKHEKSLPKNHKLHNNPYKPLFCYNWRDGILKSSALKIHACITDIVSHIYEETKRVMKGTIYEDSWYFYHDALSLITSVTCKIGCKRRDY